MDFQQINDVYKIILDKCELDKSWRWMSPDTLEAFDWLIDEINEVSCKKSPKKPKRETARKQSLSNSFYSAVWKLWPTGALVLCCKCNIM